MAATGTKAAPNLRYEVGVIRRLRGARSLEEWNEACREIRDANKGDSAWTKPIVTNGSLYEQVSATWKGVAS